MTGRGPAALKNGTVHFSSACLEGTVPRWFNGDEGTVPREATVSCVPLPAVMALVPCLVEGDEGAVPCEATVLCSSACLDGEGCLLHPPLRAVRARFTRILRRRGQPNLLRARSTEGRGQHVHSRAWSTGRGQQGAANGSTEFFEDAVNRIGSSRGQLPQQNPLKA